MNATIQVSLDEVKKLFLLLENLNSFFHDPEKYGDVQRVKTFVESGMYKQLHAAYYDTVWNWLPKDTQDEILNRPSPFG